MKKLGLALGSGGARGVAHIGFLKALEDNGIKPWCISGSSMGSVVGSCYALGMTPDFMLKTVLALRSRDLLDLSPAAIRNGTLLKSKKMAAVLNKFLGGIDFEDLKMPFSCTGVDIISGEKVVFSQGAVSIAVQASSSIPLIFAPVDYENMLVADGGIVCRVPVEEAKALGADVVVGVDVMGPLREFDELKSIFGYFFRLLDIFDTHISNHNARLHPADILSVPDLGDMSPYRISRDKMMLAYKGGYSAAMDVMDELKRLLAD